MTAPNPLLARLGYPSDARLVIFHADDVGMCHGSNTAFIDLVEAGIVRCGSIMAPCPWAPEILDYCAVHPEIDVGVHLTLNSEWKGYRWGPVTTHDRSTGMVDARGHFWSEPLLTKAHARTDAAIAELRAQIEFVRESGVDFTHLDSHMGAVLVPGLLRPYVDLGFEYGVPSFILRQFDVLIRAMALGELADGQWTRWADELEARGMPLIDHFRVTAGYSADGAAGDLAERYDAIVRALLPGVTFFSLHPNAPGDIETIDPQNAHWRTFEYDYFRSQRLRDLLDAEGIVPIGYRELRTVMRTGGE